MTETITITEAAIREANMQRGTEGYKASRDCPIGQVVCPQHPSWRVGSKYIRDVLTGQKMALPLSAQEFVDRFDDGLPVQPIEFEIEV